MLKAVARLRKLPKSHFILKRRGGRGRLGDFRQEAGQRSRQLLQGAKLRFDADIDRLRWALVQDVLSGVRTRLENLPSEPARYRAALAHYLAEAAAAIPGDDLVAELLPRDIEQFRPDWDALVAQAAPGCKVALATLQGMSAGGLRVTNAAGSVRLDNTFEGRLARMENTLLTAIMETLFIPDRPLETPSPLKGEGAKSVGDTL